MTRSIQEIVLSMLLIGGVIVVSAGVKSNRFWLVAGGGVLLGCYSNFMFKGLS